MCDKGFEQYKAKLCIKRYITRIFKHKSVLVIALKSLIMYSYVASNSLFCVIKTWIKMFHNISNLLIAPIGVAAYQD